MAPSLPTTPVDSLILSTATPSMRRRKGENQRVIPDGRSGGDNQPREEDRDRG